MVGIFSKTVLHRAIAIGKKRATPHMAKHTTTILSATVASLATATLCYIWHRKREKQQSEQLERRRLEERTGRIRAEVKLRNVLSLQKHSSNDDLNLGDPHAMKLSTIGTIYSPYPKRMGTPRQGTLVPSSRGYIQFVSSISPEAVDGIEDYSHIWVVFAFHANTSLATSKKSKIRPPRAGGIKVGQLATRSPHRPNPLGLSLVKMERWEPSSRRLYISGLDLVDETPVYDIKPYVHWDIPPEVNCDISKLRLPSWVESKDDVLPKVEFADGMESLLADFVQENALAPLYPQSDPTSHQGAVQTLKEILAQDPRSSHKGLSNNQRGSVSSETFRLLFCRVEVEFIIGEGGAKVVGIRPTPAETVANQ